MNEILKCNACGVVDSIVFRDAGVCLECGTPEDYDYIMDIEEVVIFDNEGETIDRYTIVMPNGDLYGASNNPFAPNGFGQFVGNINTDFRLHKSVDVYILDAKLNPDWLGKQVAFITLPYPVKKFIEDRL